jgi:hypothetical protein
MIEGATSGANPAKALIVLVCDTLMVQDQAKAKVVHRKWLVETCEARPLQDPMIADPQLGCRHSMTWSGHTWKNYSPSGRKTYMTEQQL